MSVPAASRPARTPVGLSESVTIEKRFGAIKRNGNVPDFSNVKAAKRLKYSCRQRTKHFSRSWEYSVRPRAYTSQEELWLIRRSPWHLIRQYRGYQTTT